MTRTAMRRCPEPPHVGRHRHPTLGGARNGSWLLLRSMASVHCCDSVGGPPALSGGSQSPGGGPLARSVCGDVRLGSATLVQPIRASVAAPRIGAIPEDVRFSANPVVFRLHGFAALWAFERRDTLVRPDGSFNQLRGERRHWLSPEFFPLAPRARNRAKPRDGCGPCGGRGTALIILDRRRNYI